MAEARIEETVCDYKDRISALPEDLLVMILELVPTKDAVSTMLLSKRWLSIWTMVPTLEYKDDTDDESKKSVWWFLNKSLQLHTAPIIDTLCMELGPQCPTTDDVDLGIRRWVAKAVDRFVTKLTFKLLWVAGPTSLPKSLYSCESLVKLTLSDKILVDVPSSVYLPSLTLLELISVVYKDEDSLVSFLSSCPVLVFLKVKRRKDDNVKNFTIKVPSLWQLLYMNYPSCTNIDVLDHNTVKCLVVDAPAMTTCEILDLSGDSCSIKCMPCLEYARIDVLSYPDDKFLKSFSSVLSLRIFLINEMVMRCSAIICPRLIKLSIYPCGVSDWFEPLLPLLGNAPKLKEFLVDSDYICEPEEDLPFSWNQPSYVPECLSSELEMFEWREYGNRVEEEEFLTYILANSKRLKTATISLRSDLKEQELIIEELKVIPRVSTTCHLLFK